MLHRMILSVNLMAVSLLAALWTALPVQAETIPSGTEMVIRLDGRVEPRSKDQQQFSASLDFPVFSGDREVLPAGTRIRGEVRGNSKEIFLSPRTLILPDGRQIDFTATVSSIDYGRLKTEGKEGTIEPASEGAGPAARQAGEIGVTGAQIGAMSTGTAMGAGIGAAAGVAAVLIGRKIAGRHRTTEIPAGTQLTLSLSQPLEVPDDAAIQKTSPKNSEDDKLDGRPVLRRAPGSELAADFMQAQFAAR
jgi:hypothetical protein